MTIILYYDDECERCRRFIARLQRFFYQQNKAQKSQYRSHLTLDYKALQEASQNIQSLSQTHHSWVVEIMGKTYTHGEAFLQILPYTPPYTTIGKILLHPLLRWITIPWANACYRRMQQRI